MKANRTLFFVKISHKEACNEIGMMQGKIKIPLSPTLVSAICVCMYSDTNTQTHILVSFGLKYLNISAKNNYFPAYPPSLRNTWDRIPGLKYGYILLKQYSQFKIFCSRFEFSTFITSTFLVQTSKRWHPPTASSHASSNDSTVINSFSVSVPGKGLESRLDSWTALKSHLRIPSLPHWAGQLLETGSWDHPD